MSFIVVWDAETASDIDEAIEQTPSGSKQPIYDAVEKIDRLLRENALQIGGSRSTGIERVFTHSPRTAHYRVTDRLKLVRVFSVSVYGSK